MVGQLPARWLRALLGVCVVLGVALPGRALAQDDTGPVRHALVIGANDGGGTLQPLRYAERDAEQFARVLTELGGFREDRVTVLYQPDVETLREALAYHAVLADMYDDDLFVLYYSGHADAQGLRLRGDTLWYEALKFDVRSIDATARLGILDACRSGSITRLKGAKVAPSLFAGEQRLAATGEVWMTATSADEMAQESESLRGGFFTHYLVSGLRGAADTGDGLVDVNELYRYTYDRVVARTGEAGATQRPHFDVNLAGDQGLALTDVRASDAIMVLERTQAGHVSVLRMSDGTQLAEVDVGLRDVRLALPAGRYLVRRRAVDGSLFEARATLSPGDPAVVRGWQQVDLVASTAKGASEHDKSGIDAFPKVDAFQARVQHYRDRSGAFVEDLNLGESPTVAGGLSLLIPGGGQLYNGQRSKAVGYFLGTAVFVGGGTVFSLGKDDVRTGGAATAIGLALWGASIADAAQHVHGSERHRPRTATAIGWSTGWSDDIRAHTGLMVEVTPVEHLSLGLDRTGYTRHPGGGWDLAVGSRLVFALEGERFRPGVFVSYGLRFGREGLDLPDNVVPSQRPLVLRGVIGGGMLVRYHVTTRYFVELDARIERDGEKTQGVAGIGMGVLVGRNRTPEPEFLRGERRGKKGGDPDP